MKFFNLFSFSLFFRIFSNFRLKKDSVSCIFVVFQCFHFIFLYFSIKIIITWDYAQSYYIYFPNLRNLLLFFFSYETHTCLVSIDRGSRKSLFNDNFHFSNSYFLCLVEFWFFYFFFQFIFFYEMVHTNQKKNLETQWAINHFIIILFIIYYYCPIT